MKLQSNQEMLNQFLLKEQQRLKLRREPLNLECMALAIMNFQLKIMSKIKSLSNSISKLLKMLMFIFTVDSQEQRQLLVLLKITRHWKLDNTTMHQHMAVP